jgi:hypothetical protein
MPSENTFWQRLCTEAEPILTHGLVVLLLESVLLAVGALLWILAKLFPSEEFYFSIIAKVDIWTALVVLSMFCICTVLRLAIRLARGVKEEYQQTEKVPAAEK